MEQKKFTDYFSLLGVDKEATKEEVQQAFIKKAMIYHPDKTDVAEEEREANAKTYHDLKDAYRILSNENSKKQYIDAQQTTDLEFLKEKRDTGYSKNDQFTVVTDKGVEFDKDAFLHSFEQTRNDKDLQKIKKLESTAAAAKITDSDYKQFLSERDNAIGNLDSQTEQVFGQGPEFNSDVFNRAFDVMKKQYPGNGLQEYLGDPMSMFSSGGLQETDNFGGMSMSYGFNYDGGDMNDIVKGQSSNPTSSMLNLNELDTGELYGKVDAMTDAEMQERMASIEADRNRLGNMDKTQFSTEPSEIEKLYSELFAPSDIEGLEAPAGVSASVVAPANENEDTAIRRKIQTKKLARARAEVSVSAGAE